MKNLNEFCNRLGLSIGTLADSLEARVKPYLEKLPLRLYSVIRMYYGLELGKTPKTTKEIGEKLGISQSRAWQLKEKAIQELKRMGVGTEQGNSRSLKQKPILIKDIDFSLRVQHVLKELGIKTLQEMVERSEEILTHRLVGPKSLMEINQVLRGYNLNLKGLSLQEGVIIEILEELNISRRSMAHILGIILKNSDGNLVIKRKVFDFIKDLKNSIASLEINL